MRKFEDTYYCKAQLQVQKYFIRGIQKIKIKSIFNYFMSSGHLWYVCAPDENGRIINKMIVAITRQKQKQKKNLKNPDRIRFWAGRSIKDSLGVHILYCDNASAYLDCRNNSSLHNVPTARHFVRGPQIYIKKREIHRNTQSALKIKSNIIVRVKYLNKCKSVH